METVDLSKSLLVEAWIELSTEPATGTLRLERGAVRKSFAFLNGAVVGVETTLPRETLLAQLTNAGALSDTDLRSIETAVRERGCTEAAALAGLKLIEPAALIEAMRERIWRSALEALSWQSGSADFDTDAKPSNDARHLACDGLDLAHRGAALHIPAERLGRPLIDSASFYATLAEGRNAALRSWIADDAVALRVLQNLDGKHRFEAAIGAAYQTPRALAALWLAERTGTLDFAQQPTSGAGDTIESGAESSEAADPMPDIEIEVVGSAAPSPPKSRPTKPEESHPSAGTESDDSPEAAEARKDIQALHAALGESNHYEMLGIDADAGAGQIKKAYFKAAKRFHPDKLARLGLEDIRNQAAEVFAAMAEANEVLSNARNREQYDERLAGGGAADDVNVSRLAQAEGFFRKSEVLLKMGDFRAASELLASAVQAWPEESEYRASLGFTLFKKSPADLEGAQAALEVAIELRPENAQAHMWLSVVLRAAGDVNGSARHATRAREIDPNVT